MRRPSSILAMSVVLTLLGFLVITQLKSQSPNVGLNGLSVQELGELVGNVTTQNNELRDEVDTLQQQRDSLKSTVSRGDSSAIQVRQDLTRILGWSGAVPVTGTGARVVIEGDLPGDAIEQLVNELRNAGAEAISVGGIRVVPGVVASGSAGAVTVDGTLLRAPATIEAIGQSEALSGSLTRAGGPIAQLAGRFPDVVITVDSEDRLTVPATTRDLKPRFGRPTL
jgi:uncharacterized protein YlxW (UPF0749 family)